MDDDPASPASDWLPLVTLVRLPTFTQLQCPSETSQPCTLTGLNLFLLLQISTDPDFSNAEPVPDGYTGNTLTLPRPSAGTIFFKLRDDPANIDSVIMPVPAPHIHAHLKQQNPQPETPDTTVPSAEAPSTTETPAAPSTQQIPPDLAPPSVAPGSSATTPPPGF